jgi:hypothetical protein
VPALLQVQQLQELGQFQIFRFAEMFDRLFFSLSYKFLNRVDGKIRIL